MACSFVSSEDTRFGQAWLTVRLGRGDDRVEPTPIVWSLTPQRSERFVAQTRTVKVGAKLWLGEGNVEVQSSGSHGEIFLDTYGLQEPSCTWEFTRTSSDEIRGTHRLALVTRAPADAPVNGTVELTATVQRKRFGLFTYRVMLDGGAAVEFSLY